MKPLTQDDLDRFLAGEVAALERALDFGAVAVLAAFDPFTARLTVGDGTADRDELLHELLPLCEQQPGGLWALMLPERRAALRGLGTRSAMRTALATNPGRPVSPLQTMFERVLEQTPIELPLLRRDELAALLSIDEWVRGILDDLPDRVAVSEALSRADLLAPMKRLAGATFVNRVDELVRLQTYVDGPPAPAPLFLFGAGGVGKSTLLSKFLLRSADHHKRPLAYLDIDRPTIRPDRPLTLVLEAITQLQPQVGLSPLHTESLVKELGYALRRQEPGRHSESVVPPWSLELVAQTFAPALKADCAILVIDTFEEVQFLGPDVVESFLRFLFDLGRLNPWMRLIVSGRALPDEYLQQAFPGAIVRPTEPLLNDRIDWSLIPAALRPISLEVLEESAAHQLLELAMNQEGLGALAPEDASSVIGIVSRNPMCLKLAARLLRAEGIEKLLSARSEIFSKLKAEKIQAHLYGRILRHLHGDEQLQKVAYPGLVVRRIDADVIREVLAEPCGLTLTPERNEAEIFRDLSKEAALVEPDPQDNSLRHRPDVRRAMLEDLTDHVGADVVDAIDRAAVAFYEKRGGAIARAEEIYHRLRLGQDVSVLSDRWLPEAAIRLKGAGDELPAAQRLWLAERLGVTLDDSVRTTASQEQWERQVKRSADRFLGSRDPKAALRVIGERAQRLPRSPLYGLEAEAHRMLGNFDEALRVARTGVDSASAAGAVDLALELLLRMAVIEEARGRLDAANRLLDEAAAVSNNTSNELLRLRVLVTQIRVLRQLHPDARGERNALRASARDLLTPAVLRRLQGSAVLLREVAAELSKDHPELAAVAIDTLGLEVASDAQAKKLGQAVAALATGEKGRRIGEFRGRTFDDKVLKAVKKIERAAFDPKVVRKWVTQEVRVSDTQTVGRKLAESAAGEQVLREFRDYFRAGVANSLIPGGGDFEG